MIGLKAAVLATALAPLLGGCTYDYLQRTDRVAYSSGNAVKANLESETINPSSHAMYVTSGLGKNGNVTSPTSTTGSSPAAPPPPPIP